MTYRLRILCSMAALAVAFVAAAAGSASAQVTYNDRPPYYGDPFAATQPNERPSFDGAPAVARDGSCVRYNNRPPYYGEPCIQPRGGALNAQSPAPDNGRRYNDRPPYYG